MRIQLILRALFELLRYDIVNRAGGFHAVSQSLTRMRTGGRARHTPEAIAKGVTTAQLFYFKRVRCLQQSVVTARLLRASGWAGNVVIGVRRDPFFGHAWVELQGNVFNESASYRRQLNVVTVI